MSEASQDRCPVCGWENAENARDAQVGDRTIRVCCEECAQALAADPAQAPAG
jgi:hypothetical protein